MKNRATAYAAMMIITLALVAVGCAPKSPADQSKEVSVSKEVPSGETAPSSDNRTQMNGQPSTPDLPAGAQAAYDKKIYFDYDRYDLTAESKQTLTELVSYLKANADLKVQITGNCDERGTNEYNIALGDKRAKVAQDYCVTSGIDPKRISTISYGEEKPADPGHDEEAWSKNRRDEFVFSK